MNPIFKELKITGNETCLITILRDGADDNPSITQIELDLDDVKEK